MRATDPARGHGWRDDDADGQRLHIIEGLLTALDRMDEVRAVVTASPRRHDAAVALVDRLGFSEVQANHVLDLTVARQTAGARADLVAEAERLRGR